MKHCVNFGTPVVRAIANEVSSTFTWKKPKFIPNRAHKQWHRTLETKDIGMNRKETHWLYFDYLHGSFVHLLFVYGRTPRWRCFTQWCLKGVQTIRNQVLGLI